MYLTSVKHEVWDLTSSLLFAIGHETFRLLGVFLLWALSQNFGRRLARSKTWDFLVKSRLSLPRALLVFFFGNFKSKFHRASTPHFIWLCVASCALGVLSKNWFIYNRFVFYYIFIKKKLKIYIHIEKKKLTIDSHTTTPSIIKLIYSVFRTFKIIHFICKLNFFSYQQI